MRVVTIFVCVLVARTAFADAPRDFSSEIRTLSSVMACSGPLPADLDASALAAHCKSTTATIAAWQTKWRDKAAPFFADIHKKTYPDTVVYPFGGGDLLNLLAVYPDAREYTTLSLEGIGDPRTIDAMKGKAGARELADSLGRLRKLYEMNLAWSWNTTIQMSDESSLTGAGLPGILSMILVALEANGYEPIEARYWHPDARGNVVYLLQSDVDAFDAAKTKKGGRKATNSVQQGLFNDIEIVFRKKGDPSAPKKTFRHIAADLSDTGLAADGGALAYLAQRKEVAAMTKAASYLLWKDQFGKVRDYLLGHMKLMFSDDTGIPPRYAKPAGFSQDVWGTYSGTYFQFARQEVAKEMIELWKDSKRPMPFHFGYYDNRKRSVLLYTHR